MSQDPSLCTASGTNASFKGENEIMFILSFITFQVLMSTYKSQIIEKKQVIYMYNVI